MKATLNGRRPRRIQTTGELTKILDEALAWESAELCLEHEESGQSLVVLTNPERALLMMLRSAEDPGFVAIDKAVRPSDERFETGFLLSNGQVDAYPRRTTVPLRSVRKAAQHFFKTSGRTPTLSWKRN